MSHARNTTDHTISTTTSLKIGAEILALLVAFLLMVRLIFKYSKCGKTKPQKPAEKKRKMPSALSISPATLSTVTIQSATSTLLAVDSARSDEVKPGVLESKPQIANPISSSAQQTTSSATSTFTPNYTTHDSLLLNGGLPQSSAAREEKVYTATARYVPGFHGT